MQLRPGEYAVLLKGNEVAKGELMVNHYLAMAPGTVEEKIEGLTTKEPTYGLPAVWIKENVKEDAIAKGYTVVDSATVLITHLSDVVRRYSHELLGRQEVQQQLDHLKTTHPKVVEELVPNLLPLGAVVKVLQNLLKEQIPVRNLLAILETLADWAPMTKDVEMLTEYVRQSLARTITQVHRSDEGYIPVMTLGHKMETALSGALQRTEHGSYMALEPGLVEKIVNLLSQELQQFTALNYQPIIICSAPVRPHFKKLIDRFIPDLIVLAYEEVLSNVEIRSLNTLELADAD
jgi:flagellar biosynthesis protein FlhA